MNQQPKRPTPPQEKSSQLRPQRPDSAPKRTAPARPRRADAPQPVTDSQAEDMRRPAPRRTIASQTPTDTNGAERRAPLRRPEAPQPALDTQGEEKRTPSSRRNVGESELADNLRSQTPNNRRAEQKRAAPAEPGTRRRTTKRQYYRVKSDDDDEFDRFPLFRRIMLVLVCYAAIMGVGILAISLWLPHHTTQETGDYVYQVGPDGDYYSRRTYSWDVVRNGDVFYLNMTEIAAYCGMTTTGDDKVMRYIVKDTEETVEFVIGQSIALVNGVQERVGGNTYLKNGKVYVPVDFVNRCINGITATVDTDRNKITVLRDTDESGAPVPIGFPYKPSHTTSSIRFADLDHELQLQILIQNQQKDPVETTPPEETEP